MKYLKTYEMSYDPFDVRKGIPYYKEDDYVLGNWQFNKLSKIIRINGREVRNWDYEVESLDEEKNIFVKSFIEEYQIERKMTPDEIKKFESIKQSNKYNL